MYGYDTAVVAWTQTEAAGYPWEEVVRKERSGARKAYLNLPHMQFTRVTDVTRHIDEFRAQFSLPKLATGSNSVATSLDMAEEGFRRAGEAIRERFPEAPDIMGMALRRVDATADRYFDGLQEVGLLLQRISFLPIRGKYPDLIAGETCLWRAKSGGTTKRCYSKFRECLEPGTEGQLRAEVQANGQRAICRRLCEAPGGSATVADVLRDRGFAERLCGPLVRVVDAAVEEVEGMGTWEAFQAFKRAGCRTDRCGALLGYAMVLQRALGDWRMLGLSGDKVREAKRAYERAGVDPLGIDFSGGPSAADLAKAVSDRGLSRTLRLEAAREEMERDGE